VKIRYEALQNDDGISWYVNRYESEGHDTTRRTLYYGLSERNALRLAAILQHNVAHEFEARP